LLRSHAASEVLDDVDLRHDTDQLARIHDDGDVVGREDLVQAAGQGLVVHDPSLAPGPGPGRDPAVLVEDLTPRETEVLQLLADGLTNKAIAQRLGISDHTVKFHVNAVLGKLDAQSRTEAVVQASRLGLLQL
jgi:DNA-binding NarL/FixJ family response regulator